MWLNKTMTSINITFTESHLQPLAALLGRSLELPVINAQEADNMCRAAACAEENPGFLLEFDLHGLSLLPVKRKQHGPIRCEFDSGANTHRRKFGGGNGQAIAKAVGVSGKFSPRVVDLTAGLGGDAFVLASLGCEMRLLERNPIVYSLLRDGLDRAIVAGADDSELAQIMSRVSLIEQDSKSYLRHLAHEDYGDIIYLDPMFPERKKSAKAKKEMQAFHGIVGADDDAAELLELALERTRFRVVVKRSASAEYLGGIAPTYSLEGKSTRFDIFALHKLPT